MRALHVADPHIFFSGPRQEECRRILDWIAGNAAAAAPDVIVISGDLFERRSTPAERLYLAEFLRRLSAAAPIVAINGNHDDAQDLRLFRAEYGFGLPVTIALEPTVINVGGIALGLLPWPDLAGLATGSIEGRMDQARTALVDILRGMRPELEGRPSLLIAHLSVTGASFDSGQPVAGGHELALTADELLESGAAGCAIGHIHLRQQMRTGSGRPVWYAGAPFRGSFGEARGTKGGLLWNWDKKAKTWQVEPWEVPARSMVLIERTWTPEEGALLPGPLAELAAVRDADVRLRVTFPAEYREAMRENLAPAIESLKIVAHMVVTEERPVTISRTRCVEIAQARTPYEKIQAWAQAVGAEVPAGAEAKLPILEAGATS
jgi:DNA repair exonuclease SbcCD nuclease subunit